MNAVMKDIILQALDARLKVISRNRTGANARFKQVYDLEEADVKKAIDWVKTQKVAQ